MKYGSLFTGIGGLDLGLDRAGFDCQFQVEIDPKRHPVLEKHFPNAKRYFDVKTLKASELPTIDALVGGFPCQPHSVAGAQKGEADERNLWPDFLRIIQATKPCWILAENVPGIRTTMADVVLDDLEKAGYAPWSFYIGAWSVGAPHRRDRFWFVARRVPDFRAMGDPCSIEPERLGSGREFSEASKRIEEKGIQRERMRDSALDNGARDRLADGDHLGKYKPTGVGSKVGDGTQNGGDRLADADSPERRSGLCRSDVDNGSDLDREETTGRCEFCREILADAPRFGSRQVGTESATGKRESYDFVDGHQWPSGPRDPQHRWEASRVNLPLDLLNIWDRVRSHYPTTLRTSEAKREAEKAFGLPVGEMDRSIDGLSRRLLRKYVDRQRSHRVECLAGLGNAVVPQVAELLGRAILKTEAEITRLGGTLCQSCLMRAICP